jgi:hypothetical protein
MLSRSTPAHVHRLSRQRQMSVPPFGFAYDNLKTRQPPAHERQCSSSPISPSPQHQPCQSGTPACAIDKTGEALFDSHDQESRSRRRVPAQSRRVLGLGLGISRVCWRFQGQGFGQMPTTAHSSLQSKTREQNGWTEREEDRASSVSPPTRASHPAARGYASHYNCQPSPLDLHTLRPRL